MSRTDKTQPFRVRLWDGTLRHVAVHDHSDGVCDLPASFAEDIAWWSEGSPAGTACRWELHYTGIKVCCCSLCHDSAGLRAERRAARHDERRRLADLVKVARTEWRELV